VPTWFGVYGESAFQLPVTLIMRIERIGERTMHSSDLT